MHELDFPTLAGLAGLAFLVAAATLYAASLCLSRRGGQAAHALEPQDARSAVFLFDDGLLVDLSDSAGRLLDRCPPGDEAWPRLMAHLGEGFPGISGALRGLSRGQTLELQGDAGGDPLRLQAERTNGLLRLTIIDMSQGAALVQITGRRLKAMERDVRLLGAISAHAPGPVWLTAADDPAILWCNGAYVELARDLRGAEAATLWPPPVLFDLPASEAKDRRKVPLDAPGRDERRWFEIVVAERDGERLHFASPADAAVRAERAMREVVQTLAKTFAHLPVGIAIFSRDRRLTLFNPALTDLSGLPASFLGDRPTLTAVLDELRNRQIIAEPKNYKSWRQVITELEAEAERGTYSEAWSLPDGRTFRVTGRPHPEGAIVLLFEDITDEVTLTRRFRKDTQLGQAILDELPIALAVFACDGTMTLANAAYTALWDIDPGSTLGVVGITDTARRWIERTAPTPVWGDLRDFVTMMTDRSEWTGEVEMLDQRRLELRCTPLPGGDSLVAFSEISRRPDNAQGRLGIGTMRTA